MSADQYAIGTLVISILTLFVSWLVYKHTKSGGDGKVFVKWETPTRIPYTIGDEILYCFIEGVFTNEGSKPVSLVSVNGISGDFVRTQQLVVGKQMTSSEYVPRPRIFHLKKPKGEYCTESNINNVFQETEIKHGSFILNETIQAGYSYVFSLALVFLNYRREERRGLNTVIGFNCAFNNKQTEAYNLIMDGTLIPEKLASKKTGVLPK